MTVPWEEPEWNSAPAWKLPGWAEPVVSKRPLQCYGEKLTLFEDGGQYINRVDVYH